MRTQTTRSRTEKRAAQPDALSLLTADHRKIRALFDRFESALESQTRQQKQIAEQICRELEIHSEIEEEIFYPLLRRTMRWRPW
jgi:hemerythrin superfamily protein